MSWVSSIKTVASEWKVISTCLMLEVFCPGLRLEPASNLLQSCFGSCAFQLISRCFCLFSQNRQNGFAALLKVTYTLFCALYCEFLTDRRMGTGLALLNSSSINMGQENMIPLDMAMFLDNTKTRNSSANLHAAPVAQIWVGAGWHFK